MKKTIGVIPLWDDERESQWMLPGYLDGILAAGGLPVVLPLLTQAEDIRALCEKCDGFLLTGGQDVSPALYGEEAFDNVECCPQRDAMEAVVLEYALEQDKPVFGICRGIQFLNVYLGGSLYQDIPTQYAPDRGHRMDAPYDRERHKVDVDKASPLYALLGKEKLGVNSCHHQAVRDLAPGLSAMAVSEDGLVEAVYMPDKKFVWAVQWHPEFFGMKDETSRKLFEAFVAHGA